MNMQEVERRFAQLPPHLWSEVIDYIDFLISKHGRRASQDYAVEFSFDWEGGLAELKEEYSAVELQHKSR